MECGERGILKTIEGVRAHTRLRFQIKADIATTSIR